VVARHVRLVKPGGYLALGVPNLCGVYGWFMRVLRPKTYATHGIGAMDIAAWSEFEARFELQTIFKAYVGGFGPRIFWSRNELRLRNQTTSYCGSVGRGPKMSASITAPSMPSIRNFSIVF